MAPVSDNPRAIQGSIKLGERGEHVRALQQAVNGDLRHWKLPFLLLEVDGVAGQETMDSVTLLAFAMGVHGKPMRRVRHQRIITEYLQKLIRGSRNRTATMVALSEQRRPQVRRWRRNNRDVAPKIVTAAAQGIVVQDRFGGLGSIDEVTGHHTAGPTDDNDGHAASMNRSYHSSHAGEGWGGIGYHYNIARSGTILCLRPVRLKGAHVGGWNTGNIGVVCHGTTGDRPTRAQKRSYDWLLRNAHTTKMPSEHRVPQRLTGANRLGHNDWPGHESNSCPGTHKPMYVD